MSKPQLSPDIINDISLLYELSLAVGTSLDLYTNCDTFLKTLLARKGLSRATIWIRNSCFDPDGDAAVYRPAYTRPTHQKPPQALTAAHPMVCRVLEAGAISATHDDPVFAEMAMEDGVDRGVYAVFPLGDIGVLKLYDRGRKAPLSRRECIQLRNVLSQFTTSLKGCLAHLRLLNEIEGRRQLKNFYEQVMDQMPAQLAVFDLEGRYLYVNTSAISDPEVRAWIIGCDNLEYCLRRGVDPAIGQKRHEILLDVIREKRLARFDEAFETPTGGYRYFTRFISPITDLEGNVVQVLGYGLDLSDLRRAEKELRESEARKSAMLQVALDCIISINEAGEIIDFNPAAEQTFGYRREDVLGRSMVDLIIPPRLRDLHLDGVERYRETGEGTVLGRRVEMVAMRADKTEFVVEIFVQAIDLEAERIFTAYLRDITERKQAEEELIRANKLAEQSLRVKERFLASMSHEMRTPLNAVIGMTHLLRQTEPSREQVKYLNGIKFSADNLLSLINDVLDFAEIGADRIEFQSVPFRLKDALPTLIDTVSYEAEKKGLEMRLYLDPALPRTVKGDPVRLNQILLNLVGNAIKFTEEGHVAVIVMPLVQEAETVTVQFSISDTGVGIPREKLAHFFDGFAQGRHDRTHYTDGTGLGLAIVKEMVDKLGGQLTVNSAVGKGTVFIVTLIFERVVEEVYERAELADEEAQKVDLSHVRILVVEDNEMNQIVARSTLEQWGAEVEVVQSGEEAIRCLERWPCDLVLMDIQMPGMDGYETTRYIRGTLGVSAQELPVLALTASTLVDHREDIEAAGMNDFILKPFDPNDLLLRIAFHLGIHEPEEVGIPHQPLPEKNGQEAADPEEQTGETSQVAELEPAPQGSNGPRYVNLAFLQSNAFGKVAFILKVIDLFITQAPEFMTSLEERLRAEDWPQVKFIAHKMKSSAGMVGAGQLEEKLRIIEAYSAREDRLHELPILFEQVTALTRIVLRELEAERGQFIPTT